MRLSSFVQVWFGWVGLSSPQPPGAGAASELGSFRHFAHAAGAAHPVRCDQYRPQIGFVPSFRPRRPTPPSKSSSFRQFTRRGNTASQSGTSESPRKLLKLKVEKTSTPHIQGWPARSCPIRLVLPPAATGTAPGLGSFLHFAYTATTPEIGFVPSFPLRPITPARYVRVFRRGAYAARNPALTAFLPVPACPRRRHPLPEVRSGERTHPDRPRGS